jgi:hypothetical protein
MWAVYIRMGTATGERGQRKRGRMRQRTCVTLACPEIGENSGMAAFWTSEGGSKYITPCQELGGYITNTPHSKRGAYISSDNLTTVAPSPIPEPTETSPHYMRPQTQENGSTKHFRRTAPHSKRGAYKLLSVVC